MDNFTNLFYIIWIIMYLQSIKGCIFHTQDGLTTEADGVRFIRVRENVPIGKEILQLNAYPRSSIILRGMERSNDHKYFRINEYNSTTVQILLDKSLDDLVDRDIPQNLLKFRIFCTGINGRNEESAYISVTVYIEDINDHAPIFLNQPYIIEVDESTSPGTIIFQGIQTFDRDKPNTPNSDVQVTLGEMNYPGGPYFVLESPHRPYVILKKSLDYDNGIREFNVPIIASDRGTPTRKSNTTLQVIVKDHDDLPPKFTEGVYRTKINEFYPMTGKPIRMPLYFSPPISAFDQDSLNATLVYDIISGNERKLFRVNPTNGIIFLEKEIDLEEESLPGNTFVLQIEARQKDSPLKRALARIEIEIMDLNDNAPEFEVDLYNISIVENLPSGFSVLQVNAMDKDQGENAEFFYNLSEENPAGAFLVDARTGWLTVRDQSLLDREARSTISMIVQAVERIPPYDTDRPKDSGTVQVEITLLDSNDNTPQFENGNLYEFRVNVNAPVGTFIGRVTAVDPDEGRNGMILYELQRPKGSGYIPFRLDSQTGTLVVSGPLRKGRIALFVEATDQPNNPSERRFSLAVVTIEVHAVINEDVIEFVGAPYEFWVGADVPIGTSVGQVRTTLDYDGQGEITYDLLHSYPEGVPFAIEERSGIVTVIRELDEFDRILYYFEAVANFQSTNKPRSQLTRQKSRSEKQVTKSGEIIEIDEGIISDTDDLLITNVTIHIVNSEDERGIMFKGTNLNPIEFHIKENLPGAYIGRLVHKNGRKHSETSPEIKDLIGYTAKLDSRENRHLNSKFRRNSTNISALLSAETKRRRSRDLSTTQSLSTSYDYISTSTTTFEELTQPSNAVLTFALPRTTKRASVWRPKTPTTSKSTDTDKELTELSPGLHRRLQRNITTGSDSPVDLKEGQKERRLKSEKPMGLRFLIANQQDVTNKITITDDGTLMTLNGLDRETRDIYRLTIIAEYSKGFFSGAGIYQVNVYVDDVNDNAPVFETNFYSAMINENSPSGTEVLLNRVIRVSDADIGKNADFTVSLIGDGNHLFAIDLVNGNNSNGNNFSHPFFESEEKMDIEKNFVTMQFDLANFNRTNIPGPYYRVKFIGTIPLDRERDNFYQLKLIAKDTGGLSSSAKLNIFVADVNDNAPMFERIAVFKDAGIEIVEYSNDLEIYFLEKMTDTKDLNTESPEKMALSATEYSIPGSPRLSNITQSRNYRLRKEKFHIRQTKKLRTPPLFSVMEDIAVGTPIIKVTAVDEDSDKNAQILYEIISETIQSNTVKFLKSKLAPFFSIDRISGEIRVNHPLQANLEIITNITARDLGGLLDFTTIRFTVTDVNNHAPEFKKFWYSFDLQEGVYYEQSIDRIEATDEDYGPNANITYRIESADHLPFRVSTRTGVLKVDGDVDRELKSKYEFFILANDNPKSGIKFTSSVEVEINILDVNDNAPEFIGYDDVIVMNRKNELDETGRKLITEENLNKLQFMDKIPVYMAYLYRNTIPGTFVKQITAIDKDYAGNGNGLVMFSLLHHRLPHLFEIDSRDGIITTISKFNRYNGYEHINLTIIASDLGSPSKSSTAMLLVNLQGENVFDEDEMNLFPHKYYEVQVEENNITPTELLKINVSTLYQKDQFNWAIVSEPEEDGHDSFVIDPKNGTLYVIKSLDREQKDMYRLKIRADRVGRESKAIPTIMYPVAGERIQGLQENEVRVVVRVTDVNDNSPKFKGNGRPIVTVIPNTANFGFPVTQVEATDSDTGINAEIRYKLLNEPSRLFGIDEKTGKIRVLGPINGDQRVYGFDVKATDRRGDDDGRSSIANVFVYVLDESRQVRLVISGKPTEVEKEVDTLMDSLSDATGMDVRVRLLEPHLGGLDSATDAYIYAVDPKTNTIVNMEDLQSSLSNIDMNNLTISPSAQILELSELGKYRARSIQKSSVSTMSGTELASIILAIIVFAGGLATSICVICVKYKRRQSIPPSETGLTYSIARIPSTLGTGHSKTTNTTSSSPDSKRSLRAAHIHHSHTMFPVSVKTTKGILTNNYEDRPREYIDVPLPKTVLTTNLSLMDHESACLRFNQIHPQDISVQSHHSSGHDSGVGFVTHERSETPPPSTEKLFRNIHDKRSVISRPECSCSRINVNNCSGEDTSSDSYEDSLKNCDTTHCQQKSKSSSLVVMTTNRNHGFQRSIRNLKTRNGMRHSFSGVREDLHQSTLASSSSRMLMRPRVNSFRNSMTDLEQRLHNLEQSFREPFHLNNSRC